jgi:hypothetical protein
MAMGLKLVDSKERIAASLIVKQEVADRGVLKSNRLEVIFRDIDHRM